MKEADRSSISHYFTTIIKWRKLIIRNIIIVVIIAAVISFILPNKYTATATILPPNPNQDIMFGMLPAYNYGSSSGFSSLAKLGGIVSGVATPSELFAEIMKSGSIKGIIINKYDLKKVFKTKSIYKTNKILDEITNITISPEGIISVSITFQNKKLAADIANSYVEELDRFNKETAMTVGKKYRIFIENRLKENELSLTSDEDSLKLFQEKNRTVALDIEVENAIATIAKLKSEIILRQVQKNALSTISQEGNPYIENLNRELSEYEKELARIEITGLNDKQFGAGFSVPFSKLPKLTLDYARLVRVVKIQEAVYALLTQQFEQAKLMELKDTPTVQFLDRAGIPERKSYPKRTLIILFAFFLSAILSIPLVFLIEFHMETQKNPDQHQTYIYSINTIKQDFLKLKRYFTKK